MPELWFGSVKEEERTPSAAKRAALDEITRPDAHIPSLMTSNPTMRKKIAASGRHKLMEGPTVPSPSEPPWFFPLQIQQGVGDISQTFVNVGSLKVSLQTCLTHSLDASRLFLCIPMDWEEPAPDSRSVSSRRANHRDNDIKGRSVTQGCWESRIQWECGFSWTQQWNYYFSFGEPAFKNTCERLSGLRKLLCDWTVALSCRPSQEEFRPLGILGDVWRRLSDWCSSISENLKRTRSSFSICNLFQKVLQSFARIQEKTHRPTALLREEGRESLASLSALVFFTAEHAPDRRVEITFSPSWRDRWKHVTLQT